MHNILRFAHLLLQSLPVLTLLGVIGVGSSLVCHADVISAALQIIHSASQNKVLFLICHSPSGTIRASRPQSSSGGSPHGGAQGGSLLNKRPPGGFARPASAPHAGRWSRPASPSSSRGSSGAGYEVGD